MITYKFEIIKKKNILYFYTTALNHFHWFAAIAEILFDILVNLVTVHAIAHD